MYRLLHGYPDYGTYMKFEDFPLRIPVRPAVGKCSNQVRNLSILAYIYQSNHIPYSPTDKWYRVDQFDIREHITAADVGKSIDMDMMTYLDILYTENYNLLPADRNVMPTILALKEVMSGNMRDPMEQLRQVCGVLFHRTGYFGLLLDTVADFENTFDDGCSLSDISEEAPEDGLTLDDLHLDQTVSTINWEADDGLTLEDLNIH